MPSISAQSTAIDMPQAVLEKSSYLYRKFVPEILID